VDQTNARGDRKYYFSVAQEVINREVAEEKISDVVQSWSHFVQQDRERKAAAASNDFLRE
jgi:DNA-binding transcriptional regulator GbsR (MarR family)